MKEKNALQDELDSLAGETFNSVALFGTTDLTVGVSEDGTSTTVSLVGRDLAGSTDGIASLTASTVDSLADIDLTDITDAIQNVAMYRAENGAEQSRLGFAAEAHTADAHGHADHHKPASYYITVALILAALTAAETST